MGVIIQMTKAVGFRQNTTAINEALLVSSLRQHELTEEAENLNEQLHKEIAERKGIELELQAARDLAVSASRAKDDFLAALSHDLRTPLSPILLLASEAAANEKLPLAVRHTFEIIAKNIAVEAQLIDDLLDVTRITQNKLSLNMQPVDAHELLRSAVETVQGDVDFKHIRLTLDLAANPCMVLGDATRLQQIFWNLLRNAVKFTPNQGGIQILTHLKDTLLVIQVVDTGIGLTTAETERVFSAFAQGDHAANTGSHRFGGLGLGLAISEKLTQLHSGKIFCASEGRGKGATFTVELPQLTEEQLQTVSGDLKKVVIADAKAYPPGRRILLVEDHEPTRSALAFLLTRRYFEVVAAASVTEACELAAKNTIDLVISDIGLPDGNGYELMTQLRDTYGLKGIALTGYGMEEDVTRSKVAGFVTHLTKPVHIHALVTALSHPDILSPRQN
jgi:signal transduction histidine kinase/CheY-like chemotaxis protein